MPGDDLVVGFSATDAERISAAVLGHERRPSYDPRFPRPRYFNPTSEYYVWVQPTGAPPIEGANAAPDGSNTGAHWPAQLWFYDDRLPFGQQWYQPSPPVSCLYVDPNGGSPGLDGSGNPLRVRCVQVADGYVITTPPPPNALQLVPYVGQPIYMPIGMEAAPAVPGGGVIYSCSALWDFVNGPAPGTSPYGTLGTANQASSFIRLPANAPTGLYLSFLLTSLAKGGGFAYSASYCQTTLNTSNPPVGPILMSCGLNASVFSNQGPSDGTVRIDALNVQTISLGPGSTVYLFGASDMGGTGTGDPSKVPVMSANLLLVQLPAWHF